MANFVSASVPKPAGGDRKAQLIWGDFLHEIDEVEKEGQLEEGTSLRLKL